MQTEAPYRRIVADIRGRIERGELQPGDRVPSTRGITQEYGVAMATATKVIAALRDQGLVETRSGAGTIVRPLDVVRPPASLRVTVSGYQHELSRDRVVRAGIAVADTEGLGMLTMRRVASELGVATMSLYRHVSGKEELVLAMTDTVFADDPLPPSPPQQWRERLATAGRRMWTVFRRHPWAAEALSMTRPQLLPHLVPYTEWVLGALRTLGFDVDDMMNSHLTLFGHVRSCGVSLQSEVLARDETGMTNEEWLDANEDQLAAAVATRAFPSLAYVVEQGYDYDLDRLFEFGLQRILDGIEAMVPEPLRQT
jgi:AcrR family transcriptional regulator